MLQPAFEPPLAVEVELESNTLLESFEGSLSWWYNIESRGKENLREASAKSRFSRHRKQPVSERIGHKTDIDSSLK